MTRPDGLRRRAAPLVLPLAVFIYTLAIRVAGITRDFWMYGDQIRDWRIALGSFRDLPLVGPATHVGGSTIGPAFYWALWTIRSVVGPWFEDLPHAGGVGQAILHSIADGMLFAGIRRRTGSTPLALAVVLIVASAPYDLALSRTIWNPMMAVTFAKIASGLVLLGWTERDLGRAAVTVAVAWAALQSHFPGGFVTVSVLALGVGQPLRSRAWRAAAARALVVCIVVATLQVPWTLYWMRQPPGAPRTPIGESIVRVATGGAPFRLGASARVLALAFRDIEGSPWQPPRAGWILAACAVVVLWRHRRDLPMLAVSVGPLACACSGFALWTGGYHNYYYFSVMPAAVLTLGLALVSIRPAWLSHAVAIALAVGAVALLPARLEQAGRIHRMPEYGPLLRASRTMAGRGQPLRRIDAPFFPAASDPSFLYRILGGRLSVDSLWIAIVGPDGQVRYQRLISGPSAPAARKEV
jgi:hypothetical protein